MKKNYYENLVESSLAGDSLSMEASLEILTSKDIELLKLLDAAYQIRRTFWQNRVTLHIINNAQNGHCPEDCHYCAQAKTSKADIEDYGLKSEDEIMEEAKRAYERGAYRYCMVFAGRGPSSTRVKRLTDLIQRIKAKYPLEICVSAGLVGIEAAQELKAAGLDRLNHNLNTSAQHYPRVCTTHTYEDRLNTLHAARSAGIQLCSGLIVGMGEVHKDVVEVALKLRELNVESIPVNFLIPIEGNTLGQITHLTPEYCLRILCLYRFLNPRCELRVAAGREGHLRSMEVMAFYPANSLFLDGYLNTKGAASQKTLRMLKDAGFVIESDHSIDQLLENNETTYQLDGEPSYMKTLKELRPNFNTQSLS